MGRKERELEGPDCLYAVVAEWKNQGPILMETEGLWSSLHEARKRAGEMNERSGVLRTCVVRLAYDSGNALLLHDMARMHRPEKETEIF
jgi:hypothetical protein